VNVPVIKPTVTFEDQFGDPITSCLIGETIKINTTVKATGNLATEQKITPKYDIEAKYLDGTPVISKTNQMSESLLSILLTIQHGWRYY
jgi:hypothetical protein